MFLYYLLGHVFGVKKLLKLELLASYVAIIYVDDIYSTHLVAKRANDVVLDACIVDIDVFYRG